MTTLNKADRDALIRVVKDRAKLAEKDVAARARVLLAEVLDLMAAEFAANDALWSDQLLLAEEGVRQLNAQIRLGGGYPGAIRTGCDGALAFTQQ